MKRGKIMEARAIANVMGIFQGDGSVKCRHCMSEEDWKQLKEERVITAEDLETDHEWIYCDYCEERL